MSGRTGLVGIGVALVGTAVISGSPAATRRADDLTTSSTITVRWPRTLDRGYLVSFKVLPNAAVVSVSAKFHSGATVRTRLNSAPTYGIVGCAGERPRTAELSAFQQSRLWVALVVDAGGCARPTNERVTVTVTYR